MKEASNFWSRRKAGVEAEVQAEEAAVEARAIEAEQAEKTDDEILADLGLPDPETLEPGDDFSGFMAKAVPDRLRRLALRKLWLTNPLLANVDGLVDYGEDFTDAACVIKNMKTAYQVGKGMTEHVEEMERQAALEAAEEEDGEGDEGDDLLAEADEDDASVDEAEAEAEDEIEVETIAYEAPDVGVEAEELSAPRRRMRFEFNVEAEVQTA